MILCVPALPEDAWPTLGPQVAAWMERNLVYGPGDKLGEPYRLSNMKRAYLYRAYQVYPQGHLRAGRRRFKRAALSLRKGRAKTEFAACIAAAELSESGPVRFWKWDQMGRPYGRSVDDPYIPMVAYTAVQSEELAYGALLAILERSRIAKRFDIGLERIMRKAGSGKALPLASAPSARDGARTTFQHFDEALALDTPIATPTGWTTMGKLKVGETILGSDGRPCRVVGKSPVHTGRPCYRVTFADDSSVVADEGHLWFARRRGGCGHGQGCRCALSPGWAVRRTGDMRDVTHMSGARPAFSYHIPAAAPLALPARSLPLDPYMLGLWLGDGGRGGAMLSVGDADARETSALVRSCGYATTPSGKNRVSVHGAMKHSRQGSLLGGLRRAGVLKEKHVPDVYLRGSVRQRLALVQGLMDSDGHATPAGWCTFVNTNPRLVKAMIELLRTLGYAPSVRWRTDARQGSYLSVAKVGFQGHPGVPVFRLPRKLARIQKPKHTRQSLRAICSVEAVPSVPVQCIAVDSPDHLFLAGEGMVPTHNTHHFRLPSHKSAHRTMLMNIPKRAAADAWSLETTTAPAPGSATVAEETMDHARAIESGEKKSSDFFFFHEGAADELDISKPEELRQAVVEASGEDVEWSDIDSIIAQFGETGAKIDVLERYWLNRMRQAGAKAFDIVQWRTLKRGDVVIADGRLIVIGFDGARYRDATALVATDVLTGYQWILGIWERPFTVPLGGRVKPAPWEVPEAEVDKCLRDAIKRFKVFRCYCDPPYWETMVDKWAGEFGDDVIVKWPTIRYRKVSDAVRAYGNAIKSSELSHAGDPVFERHIANAHRQDLNVLDEAGERMYTIRKERPDSPNKIDAAMAGLLSWEARRDALTLGKGVPEPPKDGKVIWLN